MRQRLFDRRESFVRRGDGGTSATASISDGTNGASGCGGQRRLVVRSHVRQRQILGRMARSRVAGELVQGSAPASAASLLPNQSNSAAGGAGSRFAGAGVRPSGLVRRQHRKGRVEPIEIVVRVGARRRFGASSTAGGSTNGDRAPSSATGQRQMLSAGSVVGVARAQGTVAELPVTDDAISGAGAHRRARVAAVPAVP
jgi:hypothetical protein